MNEWMNEPQWLFRAVLSCFYHNFAPSWLSSANAHIILFYKIILWLPWSGDLSFFLVWQFPVRNGPKTQSFFFVLFYVLCVFVFLLHCKITFNQARFLALRTVMGQSHCVCCAKNIGAQSKSIIKTVQCLIFIFNVWSLSENISCVPHFHIINNDL